MRIDWFIMDDEGKLFLETLLQYQDLAYYRINTIQMIIEYLFNRFRTVILLTILPIYILQVIFFTQTLLQYDYQKVQLKAYKESTRLYSSLNLAINIVSLLYNLIVFIKMPKKFFFRLITWNDLIFGGINITLFVCISIDLDMNAIHEDNDKIKMRIRWLLMAGVIVIFIKLLYFLTLIGSVAPLISMIQHIIIDIRWFAFISLVFIYSFSMSYYIIGLIQITFDKATKSEIADYDSKFASIGYVWDIIIGQQNIGPFDMPN